MHQIRLFFKNNRIDEIFKQFQRIKIISNAFYHRSKSKKLNSINFDSRYYYSNQHQMFNFFKSQNYQLRALRFSNVIIFNSIKHTINFFIKRFRQIANLKNVRAIFQILSLYLKNNALK